MMRSVRIILVSAVADTEYHSCHFSTISLFDSAEVASSLAHPLVCVDRLFFSFEEPTLRTCFYCNLQGQINVG